MRTRWQLLTVSGILVAATLHAGCFNPTDILNPDLLSLLTGQSAAILPDVAPGLLVSVQNQTNRVAQIVVSYRDSNSSVQTYTTFVQPGDKSGQMLACPVEEITLGSVSDLTESGARIALVEDVSGAASIADIPFIEVEPFGVLLRDGVNYDCGDALLFVVRPSQLSSSGYETIAFFRAATSAQP